MGSGSILLTVNLAWEQPVKQILQKKQCLNKFINLKADCTIRTGPGNAQRCGQFSEIAVDNSDLFDEFNALSTYPLTGAGIPSESALAPAFPGSFLWTESGYPVIPMKLAHDTTGFQQLHTGCEPLSAVPLVGFCTDFRHANKQQQDL
ncbi:MAG: hypothetical protein OXP09_03895 [Gammaproteobacteria bacterium]|nr:hypothetical protein [Gammaproteobacteria bacterium]